MIENNNIKLLDCTLRDGGYYNNWDFDHKIVNRYLRSMKTSSVDIVELGFRFLPSNNFMGPYAYTSDDFLEKLGLPNGPLYAVMVNGKDFIESQTAGEFSINKTFQDKENSQI